MPNISTKDLEERLRGLAAGLFALEVNTILKAGISADRWSSMDESLNDVWADYEAKLIAFGLSAEVAALGYDRAKKDAKAGQFTRLGEIAKAAQERFPERATESRALMLLRIGNGCAKIAEIMGREETDGGLSPDDFVTVRKIWELGTEEILAQTVIHIDGDVMTRVQPECLGERGHEILAIHNESIRTSINFWHTLVSTLAAFLNNLGSLFLGKK